MCKPIRQDIDPYVRQSVEVNAKRLIGHFGYTADDEEDLQQELYLDLLPRLKKYDPEHGAWSTYVTHLVTQKVRNLIKHQCAEMRHHRTVVVHLGQHEQNDETGGAITTTNPLDQAAVAAERIDAAQDDLRAVIAAIEAALSPAERTFCALVRQGSRFSLLPGTAG